MHSLYWRIFLAFWLALVLILVGTVAIVTNGQLQQRFAQGWERRGELYAEAAHAFESGGAPALRRWLESLRPTEAFAHTYVTDASGNEMLGRIVPDFLSEPPERMAAARLGKLLGRTVRPIGGPLVLVGSDGATYHVIVGPLRSGPHLFGELEMPGVSVATLLIALVVSAAVCFLLTRYLVAPVEQLRQATRRMAAGELYARVSATLKGRRDELGLLAWDLDSMAERVRNLLESKQQLLRDVSHELRSPLARLQLALSLARRQESGVERHLARIASEADRLEQLIARTLKLASLERPMRGLESVPVDVAKVLGNIVADVGIEAESHGCEVALDCERSLIVAGDPELLRSSLENVIRNAMRYSPVGSQVGIEARRLGAAPGEAVQAGEAIPAGEAGAPESERIEVIVRDNGPGVPEKDLALIFEPFYRVDAARDRAVGGEGLGLAIAARAVAIHGGTIDARNLHSGGLAVYIVLPALPPRPGIDGAVATGASAAALS